MYDNSILYVQGNAKKEDLDCIEQKFHVKIPKEIREHWLAESITAFINALTENEDAEDDEDNEK